MSRFRTEEAQAADENGFTLLETLVAFSILALSLGAIFLSFGSGASNLGHAARYTVATLIAESQMARAGIAYPYTSGGEQGTFDDTYRWKSVIRPLDGDPRSDDEGQLYEVVVTVDWGDNGQARSVTLMSIRLGSTSR